MLTEFVKVRGNYFAWDQILGVLRSKKAFKGKDGVMRSVIVRVRPEAIGATETKHCSIWASDEEAKELLEALEAHIKSTKVETKC